LGLLFSHLFLGYWGGEMYRERAGFGERLVAYVIDSFIVGLIVGIPGTCLGGISAFVLDPDTGAGVGLFVFLILLVVMILLPVFISSKSAFAEEPEIRVTIRGTISNIADVGQYILHQTHLHLYPCETTGKISVITKCQPYKHNDL